MNDFILSYLREQGNVSFSEKPLSEVDALILCQFCYLKFDGLVSDADHFESVTSLQELTVHPDADRLFLDERYEKANRELFQDMAASKRFGELRLCAYVNLVEKDWETQFSAITILLEGEKAFVAFRGTDETVVAWKEDFNMTFLSPIPAQHCALKYLGEIAGRLGDSFFLGGHSKGGNLAVYAAMNSEAAIRDKIRAIYNMDGPGFWPEVREKSAYDEIADRIVKILPRSSFIGMMFEQENSYKVIESNNIGLLQHDPFSWVIRDGHFVEAADVNSGRKFIDETVNDWILSLGREQVKIFVDVAFSILEAAHKDDLIQLGEDKTKNFLEMAAAVRKLDKGERKRMLEMIKRLFELAGLNALNVMELQIQKLEGEMKKE